MKGNLGISTALYIYPGGEHCTLNWGDVDGSTLLSPGARGHLSGGDIEVTLRFFKQFIYTLSRGYMVETFAMYPPL